MEQKALKTPIYVNETIFENSGEIPVDIDFSLPDYFPEITKLLKCKAVSRISSRAVNGRNINIEGTITISVIYSDNKNKISAYEHQHPFNKTFEASEEIEGGKIFAKTRCEYLNCRVISSRKVDIHGAVQVFVKIKKRKCTDILSDFDDPTTELKRATIPAISPVGYNEKYIVLEEEIETGPAHPPIRSLIRYEATPTIKETKIISGKVMVKGEICVNILYCPEEGKEQTVKTGIGFSQLIEIEDINENCVCDCRCEIAYLDIKPRFSGDGEERTFKVNAKLLIACEAYCTNDADVISDAFSRKYITDISKCNVAFDKIFKNINEKFSCKKSLEFTENTLCEIIDMWCESDVRSVSTENGQLSVCGQLNVYIVSLDDEAVPCYHEKSVDFDYTVSLDDSPNVLYCEPVITASSCSYTLNGSSAMELQAELCITASVYECCNMSLISDIKVDHKKAIDKKSISAMTICFAFEGENVWDIAERYHANVEEIVKINELKDEKLSNAQMLLIPN